MRKCAGKSVSRVLDLVGTLDVFGRAEDVHLGVEETFKTTIVGGKGKLSGTPLSTFHWSRKVKIDDTK